MIAAAPSPETDADIAAIVRDGVRDVSHAAVEMAISPANLRKRIARGQLWTFEIDGKIAVPVSEIRRVLAAYAKHAARRKSK